MTLSGVVGGTAPTTLAVDATGTRLYVATGKRPATIVLHDTVE